MEPTVVTTFVRARGHLPELVFDVDQLMFADLPEQDGPLTLEVALSDVEAGDLFKAALAAAGRRSLIFFVPRDSTGTRFGASKGNQRGRISPAKKTPKGARIVLRKSKNPLKDIDAAQDRRPLLSHGRSYRMQVLFFLRRIVWVRREKPNRGRRSGVRPLYAYSTAIPTRMRSCEAVRNPPQAPGALGCDLVLARSPHRGGP